MEKSINNTEIIVPFTLENSTEQRSMHFFCDYMEVTPYSKELYAEDIKRVVSVAPDGSSLPQPREFNIGYYEGFSSRVLHSDDPIKFEADILFESNEHAVSDRIFRIYFPMEGVYTYYKNSTLYFINIYTYLKTGSSNGSQNIKRVLFSDIINSYDNKACPSFRYNGIHYQEYHDIPIQNVEELVKASMGGLYKTAGEYLIYISIQPIAKSASQEGPFYAKPNTYPGSSFLSFAKINELSLINSLNPSSRSIDTKFLYNDTLFDSAYSYIKSVYSDNGKDPAVFLHFYMSNATTETILLEELVRLNPNGETIPDTMSIPYDVIVAILDEMFRNDKTRYSWGEWNQLGTDPKYIYPEIAESGDPKENYYEWDVEGNNFERSSQSTAVLHKVKELYDPDSEEWKLIDIPGDFYWRTYVSVSEEDTKKYIDTKFDRENFAKLWEEGYVLDIRLEIYNNEEISKMTTREIIEDDFESGRLTTIYSQLLPLMYNNFYDIFRANNISVDKKLLDKMSNIINVSNEVTTTTIAINKPSTLTSGVIKPVFFQAYPLDKIILHRDMKENILINLDEYKSKVDKFYLKLCGNFFPEYARVANGVIFTVNGGVITSNSGSYYICDADKMFITSGKYNCE